MTAHGQFQNGVVFEIAVGFVYGQLAAQRTEHCGLGAIGTQGLGQEFLERHEAFLVSGCRASRDVCPRSPAELALADAMTVAAMNAGAASSFPPFLCRG